MNDLVLGGNAIHIDFEWSSEKGWRWTNDICKAPSSTNQAFLNLVGATHMGQFQPDGNELARWRACPRGLHCSNLARGVATLPPQILRACQQIHQEAALIPYAENVFIFKTRQPRNLRQPYEEHFTELFNAAQRRAIVTVSVFGPCLRIVPKLAMLLPGLKRLYLELHEGPACCVTECQSCYGNKINSLEAVVETACDRLSNLNLIGAAAQVVPNPDYEPRYHAYGMGTLPKTRACHVAQLGNRLGWNRSRRRGRELFFTTCKVHATMDNGSSDDGRYSSMKVDFSSLSMGNISIPRCEGAGFV